MAEPSASDLLRTLVETQALYLELCETHAALAEGAQRALEQ